MMRSLARYLVLPVLLLALGSPAPGASAVSGEPYEINAILSLTGAS